MRFSYAGSTSVGIVVTKVVSGARAGAGAHENIVVPTAPFSCADGTAAGDKPEGEQMSSGISSIGAESTVFEAPSRKFTMARSVVLSDRGRDRLLPVFPRDVAALEVERGRLVPLVGGLTRQKY